MLVCHVLQWKGLMHQMKKIDAEEYSDNLISYLDNARSIKNITADLNNVLHRLTMTPLFNNDIENMNDFVVGE